MQNNNQKSRNDVHINTLNYFSMGGNCIYAFINTVYLNTFPLNDTAGFLAVSRYYDEYFTGVGSSRSNALYDWKAKFHCYFQRFEALGTKDDKDNALYEFMKNSVDIKVYNANKTVVKTVEGTISNCRLCNYCPCSFKLKGSPDIYQVPAYTEVDPSFILLERGDSFRGIFEYSPADLKLIKIRYAEKIDHAT